MKKGKSMVEHMRERNSMQGGPGDPKKKYTASDSAQFAQTYGRMEQNAKKVKDYLRRPKSKMKTGVDGKFLGDNVYAGSVDFPGEARDQMFKQLDSLERNPYNSTAIERIKKTGKPFKKNK
jgi:hypothetical protein